MPVKIISRLPSVRLSYPTPIPIPSHLPDAKLPAIVGVSMQQRQQGAGTQLMALFVVAILVTAIVALLFGNKIGYQRGYYALQTENNQVLTDTEKAAKELQDLRLSSKILANQADTAKQELEISLANLDELRQVQKTVKIESSQIEQLNKLYSKIIAQQGGMPLQVLGAKIDTLPENTFEYGFDVGMLSQDGKAKNLKVTLRLQNNESFVDVPLSPATYTIEGIVRIRGRFVMPEGFKPLQVKLNLAAGNQKTEQLYDWKLGAMVDNMPLSLLDLPDVDASPITTDTMPTAAKLTKE